MQNEDKKVALGIIRRLSERLADESDYDDEIVPELEALIGLIEVKKVAGYVWETEFFGSVSADKILYASFTDAQAAAEVVCREIEEGNGGDYDSEIYVRITEISNPRGNK